MEKKPIPYMIFKGLAYLALALFLVAFCLKISGLVALSWWAVFAPFTLPLGFCVVIVFLAVYLIREKERAHD